MPPYLVKRAVIHRCYHTDIGGAAVGSRGPHGPFLALSGCQTVAESSPLQKDTFVRHRPANGGLVGICHTVSHPCKSKQESRAVCLLILELISLDGVVETEGTALQHLIVGDDGIEHMGVGV